ncbi:MAG: hypothetical protein IPM63_12935 [Acidobacteriota bacterium]|nr:MAG: hypothetical protein IPM63_12935 [Acidobacteriota bacterium]
MRFCLGSLAVVLFVVSVSVSAKAQEKSKYAGEETREIKSLSADDIEALKNGRGWGLAKSAELNGYPGPMHVLELKDRIGLSKAQEAEIKGLFDEMKTAAIPLGLRLIELEKQLDDLYSSRVVDAKNLEEKLLEIGEVRARLRFVHLSAHLRTPKILTEAQVRKYNELRGYGSGDPCKNVPEGHDPDMWKKHNGCN